MKAGLVIVVALVIGQLAFAPRSWAQPTPQPQAQPQPQPQPQPTPGQQPLPANPWQAPPPGSIYQSPPPGYPYGPPPGYSPYYYGPNGQMSYIAYEAQRRNGGLAVLIEIVVPGLGSLYADHGIGALITWGLMIAGIVMLVAGLSQQSQDIDSTGSHNGGGGPALAMGLGLILLVGGRIYGLVDSYQATEEFNRKLRARLGLPAGFSLGVGPVGKGALSVGPHVGFTF
jgi:hypothetical protein